jgi:hypothetical protein
VLFPNIFVRAQQARRQPFRVIQNPLVHGRVNVRSIIVADHNGQEGAMGALDATRRFVAE